MRVCELREKEVINICDGERLGNVCDVDFEVKTGRIQNLIIPGPCKVLGILGRDHEYIVPYSQIQRIGTDVILVEVEREKCLHKCQWQNERGN